jgi:hypothetical protein
MTDSSYYFAAAGNERSDAAIQFLLVRTCGSHLALADQKLAL